MNLPDFLPACKRNFRVELGKGKASAGVTTAYVLKNYLKFFPLAADAVTAVKTPACGVSLRNRYSLRSRIQQSSIGVFVRQIITRSDIHHAILGA
jgi:hypothetical protein